MAIVIARTGEPATVVSGLTQEQKNELWKRIIGAWVEKYPDTLRSMLDEQDQPA